MEGTRMRKLIFSINVSLDGCVDHTKMNAGEDVHDFFTQLMLEADTLIYGRKTYDLMVPFWPDLARKGDPSMPRSVNDFAKAFDSVGKIVVFSRSLAEGEKGKTVMVRGDLTEEVMKLKQEPGKPILAGGVDLTSQLVALGLVDEYIFMVQPIVVGEGRRLWEGLVNKLELQLVESKSFPSGCIVLRYVAKGGA